jgi:hypothetical protein
VAQRLYGLCCSCEDLNDQSQLRHDPLTQTTDSSTRRASVTPGLANIIARGQVKYPHELLPLRLKRPRVP